MKLYTEQDLLEFGKYLTTLPLGQPVIEDSFKTWKELHNAQTRTITEGQEEMSVTFNPGQREDVKCIKQVFADTYDEIDKWVKVKLTGPTMLSAKQVGSINRLAAIAKTNLETAQMYAVKAVTR